MLLRRNVTVWRRRHLPRPLSQNGVHYSSILAIIDTFVTLRPEPRHWQDQYGRLIKLITAKWAITANNDHNG